MEKSEAKSCRKLGRHILNFGAAIAAVTLMAACAAPSGVTEFTAANCKQISKRAEAKINWARVPEVEIRIRDGEFSPMVTRLQQGRPYVRCGSVTATTVYVSSGPGSFSRITP